jgi:hypothetical protein
MARRRAAEERRLPIPPGWTSKGEIIRQDPITGKPILQPVAVAGGTFVMPTKKAQDTAPLDEVVARGTQDVALKLGEGTLPRDALVDPRPGDYVPDNEEKGYHVGEVRQPAEPVLTAGGQVRFESLPEAGPSKFEGNSAADQKARSNAREAENPDLYGGTVHRPVTINEGDVTGVGSVERLRAHGIDVAESKD